MSLIDGIWYDTKLTNKRYGEHTLGLEPNSEGILIVKCINCHVARLYLQGQDQTACKNYS